MEINQTPDYHQRSIGAHSFKGGKKSLDVVLFSRLRSCKVRCKAEVHRTGKSRRPYGH